MKSKKCRTVNSIVDLRLENVDCGFLNFMLKLLKGNMNCI